MEELFAYLMAHPHSLPPFYCSKTDREPLHRIVCDYIAGMTDNYLQEQHQRLIAD
jgi:dGTPase